MPAEGDGGALMRVPQPGTAMRHSKRAVIVYLRRRFRKNRSRGSASRA
jgi:hypothetical protein